MDEFTSFLNLIKRSEAEEQGKFATDFAENMAKIDNAFSSTKQKLDDIDAALNGKASTTHADTHITGGTDVIADAVAGGSSGLMSGADKQNLDAAVAIKHDHANKALLDTYTQTEANLADAVAKKHTQGTDQYLDYGGANQVAVGDVKDAVSKKHTQGTDTTLGTMTADINMNSHKLTNLAAPSAAGDSIRQTTKITEANLEDAIDKKHKIYISTSEPSGGSDGDVWFKYTV